MLEINYIIAALLVFFSTTLSAGSKPLVVIDAPNTELPSRFRTIKEAQLHVIGSGQFSKAQLITVQKQINAPIVIIDLRQESHGFVNDLPVSLYGEKNWQNKGLPGTAIESQQQQWLTAILGHPKLTLYKILAKNRQGQIIKTTPLTINPVMTYSEKQLAKTLNMGYVRFYITDHSLPTPEQLLAFKQLVNDMPEETWLYFHCRGGIGRTTLFMILYEILKVGKNKSLDAILQRHIAIGGRDFTQLPPKLNYKYHEAVERLNLINTFYQQVNR